MSKEINKEQKSNAYKSEMEESNCLVITGLNDTVT